MPKLFLYKASDADLVVILRRGRSRYEWQMIRWDLSTDTFQPGQWLERKQLDPKTATVSGDGKFFAYGYDVYHPYFNSVAVVSYVPNFTAVYFSDYSGTRYWYRQPFDCDGNVVSWSESQTYQPRGDHSNHLPRLPRLIPYHKEIAFAAPTWIENDRFIDHARQRVIVVKEGKLVVERDRGRDEKNDNDDRKDEDIDYILYDTTNHTFEPVPPVEIR